MYFQNIFRIYILFSAFVSLMIQIISNESMLITKALHELFEQIDLERLKRSFSKMAWNDSDTSEIW